MDTSRLEILAGKEAIERLKKSAFLICGIGGVGGWAAEALARCGVGHLTLVDFDCVNPSNANRQIVALESTFGKPKVHVLADRLKEINPQIDVDCKQIRITPQNIPELLASRSWNGVLDAIDERDAKLALLAECVRHNMFVVSSLGAANMTQPNRLEVTTLAKTAGNPLARIIRKNLRRMGIEDGITCVSSSELPLLCDSEPETPGERRPMGAIVTVTATAGFLCADALMQPLLRFSERPRRGETQCAPEH